MDIELKCYATLRQYCPSEGLIKLQDGTTIQQALSDLGVPLDEVKLIFINGLIKEPTEILKQGDRLGIFPPVGGG